MTTLRINCCEDCPHSRILNKEGLDDSYIVECNHPEQTSEDPTFIHKIRFSQSVYFKCPLNNEDDFDPEENPCPVCGSNEVGLITKQNESYIDCFECGSETLISES